MEEAVSHPTSRWDDGGNDREWQQRRRRRRSFPKGRRSPGGRAVAHNDDDDVNNNNNNINDDARRGDTVLDGGVGGIVNASRGGTSSTANVDVSPPARLAHLECVVSNACRDAMSRLWTCHSSA